MNDGKWFDTPLGPMRDMDSYERKAVNALQAEAAAPFPPADAAPMLTDVSAALLWLADHDPDSIEYRTARLIESQAAQLAERDAEIAALKKDVLRLGGEAIRAEVVALELQQFVDMSGDIDRAKKAIAAYSALTGSKP